MNRKYEMMLKLQIKWKAESESIWFTKSHFEPCGLTFSTTDDGYRANPKLSAPNSTAQTNSQ